MIWHVGPKQTGYEFIINHAQYRKMDEGSQVRQNLQKRLHSAVKQCQISFGASEDVATEADLRVSTLCTEWEAVLTHGLKKQKSKIRGLGKAEALTGMSFWPVISPFLSEEDIERFARLKSVNTDIGKGRAWLRAAINERTLENYLHSLLANIAHLQKLYDSTSFLLDEERASMLPTMAAGLNSIIFSLSIDSEYLNTPLKTVDVPPIPVPPVTTSPAPIVAQPPQSDFASRFSANNGGSEKVSEEDCIVAVKKDKKKKTKKSSPRPQTTVPQSINHTSAPTVQTSSVNPYEVLAQSTFKTEEKDSSREPSPLLLVGNRDALKPLPLDNYSLPSTPSVSSLNSIGDEVNPDIPLFNAPLAPSKSPNHDHLMNDPQLAIESTSMVLAATVGQQLVSEQRLNTQTNMTPDEMKEALKVLVRSKEEAEERSSKYERDFMEERLLSNELKEEVSKLRAELASLKDSHSQQIQNLERENDLLREQLKRYVAMVQQQQQDEEQKSISEKLSEMAEMYGELMEFNDRLHKDVYTKDSVITKLCHTLLLAGMDIPVSHDQLPTDALEPIKPVDVWIPSVIKRDKGHHVYQIYIKIGIEEWNVYRRFAEFYEFHQQMMRNIEGVEEFPFPPKKAIGSKTAQVVEDRRARLQEYLRFIVDTCSRPTVKRKDGRVTKSLLDRNTSKEDFLHIFPFFKNTPLNTNPSPSKAPLIKSPSYSGL